MTQVVATILAGGQGARFWPISRMKFPKQFLSISSNGESLIQATARRITPLVGKDSVMIVTNILHEKLIREHVPTAQVVSEPIARNTAASIGLAAVYVAARSADGVMIVLPADHAVADEGKFRNTLQQAVDVASQSDTLVTIGIQPTSPNTAYGYIQRGKPLAGKAYAVARFYEKPNIERAEKYLESGDFFWNSGMFVWRAKSYLDAVSQFLPDLHAGLMRVREAIGTSRESETLKSVFDGLESVSVDFGVLEHARNCAVVPAQPYGWNDVGSWDAWAEHFKTDDNGNLLHGPAMAIDSEDCVVYSKDRLIAVLGGQDLVVIDAGDALMVCPRSRVQDVRKIVDELKRKGRTDLV